MIQDSEVSKALDWLRDKADEDAQAKAERLYLEHYLKTVLAQEQSKAEATSVAAAEVEARQSTAYRAALENYKTAVYNDEKRRFLRSAAETKIEVWRTEQANMRRGNI